jgi:hypothetical protein
VSSTEIRRRVAAGESTAGLVSPAIAAYIGDHALYQIGTETSFFGSDGAIDEFAPRPKPP